jgi:hypothetical protein
MNVRQVQKSIVPILLLQLIGEFFTFFFVHIIMDDSRERLAVFSWSLCGSLVIHGGWWWSVGNGLVWSLRGADENQNIQRANKRWKDLIPIGQLMTSILSFSRVVHLLYYTVYSVIHLSKEIALMLLVDLFSPSVLRSDFGKVIVSSLLEIFTCTIAGPAAFATLTSR